MIDLSGRMEKIRECTFREMNATFLGDAPMVPCVHSLAAAHSGEGFQMFRDGSELLHFNLLPLPNCGAVAVFCNLYVDPAHRRKGIARAIEALVRRAAQRARLSLLLATARVDDYHMVTFFHSCGWVEVDTIRNLETGNVITLFKVVVPALEIE